MLMAKPHENKSADNNQRWKQNGELFKVLRIRHCETNRLLSKPRNYLESPYDPDVFTAMRMARDTIHVGLWVRPKTKLICIAECYCVCPFETYWHTAAKGSHRR